MRRSFLRVRWMILAGLAVAAWPAIDAPVAAAAESGFSLRDQPGKCLDVMLDGRIVARYMDAYDKSTPKKRDETYKPYLHVFDTEGQEITKGPGGEFTHHRGIFIGWNKITFQGKDYDRWHMKGGEIVHQKFASLKAGPDAASFTSLTHWNDAEGQPILEEQRTIGFQRAPPPARLLIDFTAKLNANRGEVLLGGDPEHAGIHFRPADEVIRKETVYVFPREKADARKDLDYPWVGETCTLRGKRFSVVDMNHPDNPKKTKFSAYRDYGRFGAFFIAPIKNGESLTLKYRFLIADGEMPAAEVIQKCWDEFAAATSPSPVPKLTVKPADGADKTPGGAKTPKPKKADAAKKAI
jgi:hypothetical protein